MDESAWEWWQFDEARLEREQREVLEAFPDLEWLDIGPGGWEGELPIWPFERARPTGLLMAQAGLRIRLEYPESYPMSPPAIVPLDPSPGFEKRTLHKWHVNGDGSLCLLQTASLWDGRHTARDLLLKAAGWRIEFELVGAEMLESMTVNGIVTDSSVDSTVSQWVPSA